MRGRALRTAALALVLAACGRQRPAPAPAPAPTPASAVPAAAAPAPSDATDPATPRDIARELVRIFGDSATLDSARADEPTWDINVTDYETHARVEYFIGRMSGPARSAMEQWLARGSRYDAMIRAKLRAGGLPEDLTYLALIESGYDPHAYSRAAAVGMWQFMTTTARGVGLRVDWWVDERRDPVRSTDGAVKFLGWLNEQFGSLYLAAAAYNGGPSRVSRGLSRLADSLEGTSGDDAFFVLADQGALRNETKDYVPKLIAAALVAKDPARYGITVRRLPAFEYDSARVGPWTPLAAVGKAVGLPTSEVAEYNSHYLRGVTPPRDSSWVRLPKGKGAGFAEALAALPEEDRRAFTRTTTKKGETRAALARRVGLTTAQLAAYNRDLRVGSKSRLVVGQTVLVPTRAVLDGALDIPDPEIERYGSSSRSRGAPVTHVVRRGESLGSIAKKYRTTVAALKKLNHLKKTVIYPGQEIVVRGGSSASSSRTASARRSGSSSTRVASSTKGKRSASKPVSLSTAARMNGSKGSSTRTHVVKRGESLTSIARRYGTTVAALKELNGMRGDDIQAGKRIKVGG